LPALAARLAAEPDWRPTFIAQLAATASSDQTPLKVLTSLRDGPAPPTDPEIAAYLQRLTAKGGYGRLSTLGGASRRTRG
jgi:hypothetical protein